MIQTQRLIRQVRKLAPEHADKSSVGLAVKFVKCMILGCVIPVVLKSDNRGVSFYFSEGRHALKITVGPDYQFLGESSSGSFKIPSLNEAAWIARTFTWRDTCLIEAIIP